MEVNPKPTVDVVIPTYERPHEREEENNFVLEALKSVLSQTFTINMIFVVIDGQSKIVAGLIKKQNFSNVRVIETGQKVGGSNARNIGVSASEADYIAFLDDDDLWYTQKIEEQIREICKFSGEENLVVFNQVKIEEPQGRYHISSQDVYENNENISNYVFRHINDHNEHFDDSLIITSSIIASRKLLIKIPFKQILRFQDTDWEFRAYFNGHGHFLEINKPLTFYRTQYSGRNHSVSSKDNWSFANRWIRQYSQFMKMHAIKNFYDIFVIPVLYSDENITKGGKIKSMFSFGESVSLSRRPMFTLWLAYRMTQRLFFRFQLQK
ncbi:glycosyltransferase family 2 protein [Oenococcus sicerae]|uniref:glycosyltransferase family 2 protein n=1 Tax=Oenococcus sicerae TaxID=2203724 RepID=UPI0010B5B8D4|nr:hypothetical protein OAL24_01508 [Oenococcus sicerae]